MDAMSSKKNLWPWLVGLTHVRDGKTETKSKRQGDRKQETEIGKKKREREMQEKKKQKTQRQRPKKNRK